MTTVRGEHALRKAYNELMKNSDYYTTLEELIKEVETFAKRGHEPQLLLKTGFIKHNYPNSFTDALNKAFNALEGYGIPYQYISIGEDNSVEERENEPDELYPSLFTKVNVEIDYTGY
jgi:hypothetical protein